MVPRSAARAIATTRELETDAASALARRVVVSVDIPKSFSVLTPEDASGSRAAGRSPGLRVIAPPLPSQRPGSCEPRLQWLIETSSPLTVAGAAAASGPGNPRASLTAFPLCVPVVSGEPEAGSLYWGTPTAQSLI